MQAPRRDLGVTICHQRAVTQSSVLYTPRPNQEIRSYAFLSFFPFFPFFSFFSVLGTWKNLLRGVIKPASKVHTRALTQSGNLSRFSTAQETDSPEPGRRANTHNPAKSLLPPTQLSQKQAASSPYSRAGPITRLGFGIRGSEEHRTSSPKP